MPLTLLWAGGAHPDVSTALTTDGNEGHQNASNFARETSTVPIGGISDVSYKKDHSSAGLTAILVPVDTAAILAATSHLGCTFWLHATDYSPADYVRIIQLMPTGGTPAYSVLSMKTDGAIHVAKGSDDTSGASSGAIFSNSTAYYFMYTVEWNGTTSYRHRLWVWGSADATDNSGWTNVIDFTETDAAITSSISRFHFTSSGNLKGSTPNTITCMSSMTLWTFADDTDLPTAPYMVGRLRDATTGFGPVANGTDVAFTNVGGTGTNPDFNDVDDLDADDATTMDRSPTSGTHYQTYGMANVSFTIPTDAVIKAVVGGVRAITAGVTTQIVAYDNATRSEGAAFTLVTNYQPAQRVMMLAPSDNSVWTETRVNSLELGMKKNTGVGTVTVSMVYGLVVILPAAPSGQPILRRSDHVPHMALGNSIVRRRY